MILYGPVTLDWIDITYKKRMNIRQCSFYVLFMPVYPLNAFVLGDILYDTLDRIDITYRKRMLFVDVRFMFVLLGDFSLQINIPGACEAYIFCRTGDFATE